MSQELKPCPHCNKPVEAHDYDISGEKHFTCDNCHYTTAYDVDWSMEKCIEKWNTRTPNPMPPELVEEMEAALQFLAPIISYYERVKPLEGNFDSAQPAINWDGNSITLGDLFKAKEAITKIQAWRGR